MSSKKCEMCGLNARDRPAKWRAKYRNAAGKTSTIFVCDIHSNILSRGWIKLKL